MSNNYFNRARTAKNRIEDTEDVIELVDSSKHIYYVRTNQHEYLVDLSFTANSELNADGTLKVESEHHVYNNSRYDMRIPDIMNDEFKNIALSNVRLNEACNSNSNIIPTVGEYPGSGTGIASEVEQFIFNKSRNNDITGALDNLNERLGRLGYNQYRDFDYQNIINSRSLDYYNVYRDNNDKQKKTPITYCNELSTFNLSWGLPNIEVLTALLFNGDRSLSNRVLTHYYGDGTSIENLDKNIIFGVFTQYILKVIGGGFSDGSSQLSSIQCIVSLNRIGNPTSTNCDFLWVSKEDEDAYGNQQHLNIEYLIEDGGKSLDPSMLILINNIKSRVSIRTNDGTNNYVVDLPMLIIPTAIIR